MRIVHVYKDFDPPVRGGMERHIALMCRYQRDWAEVEALTCSRSGRTRVVERAGTRVTEVGEWGRVQSAPVSPLFPWYMGRARADVLVVHVPNPTAEVGWLLARPGGKLVVRYHSDVVRQASAMRVYGPVQMKFLEQADIILPTSEPYLRTSPVLQRLSDRCRVTPLGIQPELFANPDAAQVAELRERYGGRFVFFCGRHRYYKGLEYLVRAAPAIGARIVIGGDGPERGRCEALAKELNADVVFTGELSEESLVAHLHACEVFVFPSVARSEAFGIAILEAHACGTPVVATRLGTGTEYANVHEETGLNVAPRDAEDLGRGVNALLADPARARAMGERGRERVLATFNAASVAREEFEIYRGLFS